MKITRALLGKRIVLTWRDPCDWTEEGDHQLDTTKGASAPPVWQHIGWVEDISDGWVRVRQSHCQNAVNKKAGVLIYEDLIEAIEVWPDPEPAPPKGTQGSSSSSSSS